MARIGALTMLGPLFAGCAPSSTFLGVVEDVMVRDFTLDAGDEPLIDDPWARPSPVFAVRDPAGACEPSVALNGSFEHGAGYAWVSLGALALVDASPVRTAPARDGRDGLPWLFDPDLDLALVGGAEGWLERSTTDRFAFVVEDVAVCDADRTACGPPVTARLAFTGHPGERLEPFCSDEGVPDLDRPPAPSGLPWCGLAGDWAVEPRACVDDPWADALLALPPAAP